MGSGSLSDDELDRLLPSEGYAIVKPNKLGGPPRTPSKPWWWPPAYLKLGARLSPIEVVLCQLLPLAFLWSHAHDWFLFNGACQLAIFLPLVVLPALATGHLAYVDIGWPLGLVALAANSYFRADGYWLRRSVISGCLALHGGRMALGALVLFFPYRWTQDLPRYRYARLRWERDGMPPSSWPLKLLHDALQQAAANIAVLAAPLVLCAFDRTPCISSLEMVGWTGWLVAWGLESLADSQKMLFTMRLGGTSSTEANAACLGLPPYAGSSYWLWTRSRHPNYFFEWAAWCSLSLAALPSLARLEESAPVKAGFALALYIVPRFFYDCLLYWTGAEPAEHFSAAKRPSYREYQRTTRVFWPFELPLVDHGRRDFWPRPGARVRFAPS